MVGLNLRIIKQLINGKLSWHTVSGPLTVASYAGESARMGVLSFVGFLAVVSIGLGVLNLLPIPLLDGGHLMYYAVEWLTGSPVSQRVVEWGQRVGLAALLALMLVAFYNDITRLSGF
jgi:regulator of sigma E protease